MIVNTSDGYAYQYGDVAAPGFQIPYTQYNVQRLVLATAVDFADTLKVATRSAGGATQEIEGLPAHVAEFVMGSFDAARSAAPFWRFMEYLIDGAYDYILSDTSSAMAMEVIEAFNSSLNQLLDNDAQLAVLAAGFVRSRLVGTDWQRSDCSLVLATPMEGAYKNFGLLWAIAADAWNERAEVAASDRYLNEGGDEDQLGENF